MLSNVSYHFASLHSEQGFFQNCKPGEAKEAVGEHEDEGDPGSHCRSRAASGRHYCYSRHPELRREGRIGGRFQLTWRQMSSFRRVAQETTESVHLLNGGGGTCTKAPYLSCAKTSEDLKVLVGLAVFASIST